VDQPTILIISDDVEFSRAVSARWQAERMLPAFTLMGADLCHDLDKNSFNVAIIGSIQRGTVFVVLQAFESIANPVIFVSDDPQAAHEIRQARSGVLVLYKSEDWLDNLVLVAGETLRQCEATTRARRAEQANAALERHATLGRYMLEMRHTFNNALTSVLGNSELLLLEPGALSAEARPQVETIRQMAVRIHEILQRFTSIEKELCAVEKVTNQDAGSKSRVAAANF